MAHTRTRITVGTRQKGFGDARLLGIGLILPAVGVLLAFTFGGARLWAAVAGPEQKLTLTEQLAKEAVDKQNKAERDEELSVLLKDAPFEISELGCGLRPAKHALMCIGEGGGYHHQARTFEVRLPENLPLTGVSYRKQRGTEYILTYSVDMPRGRRMEVLRSIQQALTVKPEVVPAQGLFIFG